MLRGLIVESLPNLGETSTHFYRCGVTQFGERFFGDHFLGHIPRAKSEKTRPARCRRCKKRLAVAASSQRGAARSAPTNKVDARPQARRRLRGRLLRRRLRRGGDVLLRRGDQRRKAFSVAHGHIRQNLPVNFDATQLQPVNQLVVGGAIVARCRANALDPQRAEIALAGSPVAIAVPQRAVHRLLCRAEQLSLGEEKSLGVFQQLLAPRAALGATFYSGHGSASPVFISKPVLLARRRAKASAAVPKKGLDSAAAALISAACS